MRRTGMHQPPPAPGAGPSCRLLLGRLSATLLAGSPAPAGQGGGRGGHGVNSSKGRTHGQIWKVQLRRGNDVLIVAIGLPKAAADTLAERINEFL